MQAESAFCACKPMYSTGAHHTGRVVLGIDARVTDPLRQTQSHVDSRLIFEWGDGGTFAPEPLF